MSTGMNNTNTSDQVARGQVGQPSSDHQAESSNSKDVTAEGSFVQDPEEVTRNLPRQLLAKVRRVARTAPTLLVIGALVGIMYVGHHYGWKIPKFSELSGGGSAGGVEWCEEHGVPEAECIACNADLMPKPELYGWCKEHGVHECTLHHPETAQLNDVPEVTQADFERASRAIALRPRTKNNPTCKMHLRRIQFPSIDAADKAGIDIGLAERGRVVEFVPVTGEAIYDPTLVARMASRASGTVWRTFKHVGDRVKAGEILALIDAAEVGQAKADLLQAVSRLGLHNKTVERLTGLTGVVPGKSVLEAEAARAAAEADVRKSIQTLRNLGLPIALGDVDQTTGRDFAKRLDLFGLPPSIAVDLDAKRLSANLIPVVAPRDGVVVERDVVAGEVIATTKTLYTIADTSRMWLVLNMPLEDAKRVTIGQEASFLPDGADHAEMGTLTWISTNVDNETRTVKVRAELPNEDGHLRNGTFGTGQILLREEANAIVVSSAAVHWEGCCHVVFVRDKNYMKQGSYKVFHTRSVRPGVVMGDTTELIAGLLPGEVVVTKGSGVLRAELLKGNLGAG